MKKYILVSSLFFFHLFASTAVAGNYQGSGFSDNFGKCPSPGGTQIAGYEEGEHQIAGGGLLSGSDYVFEISSKRYVQCFCPTNPENKNSGIQTNWNHMDNLSSREIKILLKLGWLKIENGSDWGLTPGTYYAKNISFDCSEKDKDHEYSRDFWKDWQDKDFHYLTNIDFDFHKDWQAKEKEKYRTEEIEDEFTKDEITEDNLSESIESDQSSSEVEVSVNSSGGESSVSVTVNGEHYEESTQNQNQENSVNISVN
ncbi:MAG: hypothetical protein UV73_C0013G0015 [Candidatus Gottesmanbacteria bacterium GW2011_GWA2_43_14]|uniref:Uncharacterized protein n=1 Tax=Candidatus Gottesmanbacteria bacterium GW2011_GWA2_43_14 TaxID=1618443 RepID=A0A0G1DDB0_9BACT|nr:MAG: hypothetical protein UV73_C0013G0015 [Candidatus Gottesmanbacteria bacterium GW2011_GWA2_43_14]